MIPFIFFMSIVTFLLLGFAFYYKIYALGMAASMGIIVIGVTTLGNGMSGINSTLTLGLGVIYVGLGSFVFINGSLETIEEF